jgi:hypothetical protein
VCRSVCAAPHRITRAERHIERSRARCFHLRHREHFIVNSFSHQTAEHVKRYCHAAHVSIAGCLMSSCFPHLLIWAARRRVESCDYSLVTGISTEDRRLQVEGASMNLRAADDSLHQRKHTTHTYCHAQRRQQPHTPRRGSEMLGDLQWMF